MVTNGIRIAEELAGQDGITILMPGGRMRWEALSVVGPWGDGFFRRINIARAFLGAAGFTIQSGLTDATEEEAQIKRAMVSGALEVTGIVDHTKWGRAMLATFCRTDRIAQDRDRRARSRGPRRGRPSCRHRAGGGARIRCRRDHHRPDRVRGGSAVSAPQRIGFTMRLLPGREAEYRRRHAAVWPELLADLRAAGARNYSIFLRGDDLFAYLEVDDFDSITERRWPRATANARWQAEMAGPHRPADRPGDGVPPAARRGLPPRLMRAAPCGGDGMSDGRAIPGGLRPHPSSTASAGRRPIWPSRSRRGGSSTPGRGSGSSRSRAYRATRSRRSRTRPPSPATPGSRRPSRCTSRGTRSTITRALAGIRRGARNPDRRHQLEHVPGRGLQARRRCATRTPRVRRKAIDAHRHAAATSPGRPGPTSSRSGWRTAPTTRARTTSGRAGDG